MNAPNTPAKRSKNPSRLLALLLALTALAAALTACGNPESSVTESSGSTTQSGSAQNTGPQTLRLPYSKADGLNPYTCKSMVNRRLCALLYEGLYQTDATYRPVPLLASQYSWSGATELLVTLKSAVFSDGSALTAADVVNAFQKAKTAPAYEQRLANFLSAKEEDGAVRFRLQTPDPYAAACLDFAIAKLPEDAAPVGSGRYRAQAQNAEMTLVRNEYKADFLPKMEKIILADVSDSTALPNAVVIGNIHFTLQELEDGRYQRVNATATECGLNNLVYLAFNSNKAALQHPSLRKAMHLLLDRDELTLKAFQTHARAAYTPFNPDWYAVDGISAAFRPDAAQAQALLEEAGLHQTQKQQTQLTLLCNADNGFKNQAAQLIAQQLAQAGLQVQVKALAFEEYEKALRAGQYDLYLGEVRLCANMDLSAFFVKGGSLSYGIQTDGDTALAYQSLREGKLELTEFLSAFREQLPFLPLCYRNGVLVYTRSLNPPAGSHDGDLFADIQQWTFL